MRAHDHFAGDGYVYDAFVSYSRKNADAADKIERDLQTFPLPRGLRRKLGRRNLNIFRDVNDLTGNRLTPALEQNLRRSRTLVVLCSPAARASLYVGLEITRFAELRDPARIVPVLIGGAPNNELGTDPAEWAFPDSLAAALGDVPLAPDLRTAWAVKGRRARIAQGSPWVQLVAGIVDVPPDDLTERIARSEKRRVQALAAALTVVLVVVSTLAVVAWTQRNNAVEQARIATARQLAATAKTIAENDLQTALLVADTAYRTHVDPQTVEALHSVANFTPQLVGFSDFGEPLTRVDGTPDAAVLVAGAETGAVYRMNRATGASTEALTVDAPVEFLAVSEDGATIAATGVRYDGNAMPVYTRSALWREGELTTLPNRRIAAVSPSGDTVALWRDEATVEVVARGRPPVRVPVDRPYWVALPSDAEVVTMSPTGEFHRVTVDGSRHDTTQVAIGQSRVAAAFSADGSRFTYISQGLENEVWNLSGPWPSQTVETDLVAYTGNPASSDIALNATGTKMATAAEGSIFVSDVRSLRESPAGYTVLRGAGTNPRSIRFLSDDVIVSASGTNAALWDLRKEYSAGLGVPADVVGDCTACGPPRVAVSPDAGKAVIANRSLPGATLVDFTAGTSHSITLSRHDDFDAPPMVMWLDENRVLAYGPDGDGAVRSGERLEVVEREFALPQAEWITRMVLRDDGRAVAVTDRGLVVVDPQSGRVEEPGGRTAVAVSSDGTVAVDFRRGGVPGDAASIDIIDVGSGRVVTGDVDGPLLPFVEHIGGAVSLLRNVGGCYSKVEVLQVDSHSGTERSARLLGDLSAARSDEWVSSADALFVDETVVVASYSLRDDLRLRLIPVEPGHRTYNLVGLNRDGSILVLASQATQRVTRIPVTPDAWSRIACESAGRSIRPGELERIVKSAADVEPGCGVFAEN